MRLLLVIHRFGPEIVGGAERLALDYARRLGARGHEVDVATTRARDYRSWRDDFPAGDSTLACDGGASIRVHRFGVARERSPRRFDFLSRLAHRWPNSRRLASLWMRAQGPDSPALAKWVAEQAPSFDAIILFNYLYFATWSCMPACADRALFVPLAHDEPPLKLAAYADLFRQPRALLWSSNAELALLRARFGEAGLPAARFQGGAGLEFAAFDASPTLDDALAEPEGAAWLARQPADFADAMRRGRFFLSLGRIAEGKDAPFLASTFTEAHAIAEARADSARISAGQPEGDAPLPPLLIVGPMELRDPAVVAGRRDVLASNGAAPESVARALMARAIATLHASPHESLNLAAAESLASGTPVLARASSLATVELVEESGCGGVWSNAADLAPLLATAAKRDEDGRDAIAQRARGYARSKFDWDAVMDRIEEALRFAASASAAPAAPRS